MWKYFSLINFGNPLYISAEIGPVPPNIVDIISSQTTSQTELIYDSWKYLLYKKEAINYRKLKVVFAFDMQLGNLHLEPRPKFLRFLICFCWWLLMTWTVGGNRSGKSCICKKLSLPKIQNFGFDFLLKAFSSSLRVLQQLQWIWKLVLEQKVPQL